MMNTQIAAIRMFNQRISEEQLGSPMEVVRWMGAMQAQDYGQAVWGIGLRTISARLTDIERALAERKIVRTWPMRGTLHFVPAEDAKWMVAISAERMIARDRLRQKQLGLNEAILERSMEVFDKALKGGRELTRSAVMGALEDAGIRTEGQRGYHMLWHAALKGQICMGAKQEKQQTFALLDDLAPEAIWLGREEGLAELARRYFNSHGPAALQDFAWWAGLTLADARRSLEANQQGLVSTVIEGVEYWTGSEPWEAETSGVPDVHLLPGFDEYLLGYTERSAVLANEHAWRVAPGGNGMFRAMLVVNGEVTGTWKRTVKKKGVEIELERFEQRAVKDEVIEEAAQRYCDFLGLPLASLRIRTSDS